MEVRGLRTRDKPVHYFEKGLHVTTTPGWLKSVDKRQSLPPPPVAKQDAEKENKRPTKSLRNSKRHSAPLAEEKTNPAKPTVTQIPGKKSRKPRQSSPPEMPQKRGRIEKESNQDGKEVAEPKVSASTTSGKKRSAGASPVLDDQPPKRARPSRSSKGDAGTGADVPAPAVQDDVLTGTAAEPPVEQGEAPPPRRLRQKGAQRPLLPQELPEDPTAGPAADDDRPALVRPPPQNAGQPLAARTRRSKEGIPTNTERVETPATAEPHLSSDVPAEEPPEQAAAGEVEVERAESNNFQALQVRYHGLSLGWEAVKEGGDITVACTCRAACPQRCL
jgi:hypothetical protein